MTKMAILFRSYAEVNRNSSWVVKYYFFVCEEEKGNKEKRKGGRMKKTTRVPRFAFQTRSADDILDV